MNDPNSISSAKAVDPNAETDVEETTISPKVNKKKKAKKSCWTTKKRKGIKKETTITPKEEIDVDEEEEEPKAKKIKVDDDNKEDKKEPDTKEDNNVEEERPFGDILCEIEELKLQSYSDKFSDERRQKDFNRIIKRLKSALKMHAAKEKPDWEAGLLRLLPEQLSLVRHEEICRTLLAMMKKWCFKNNITLDPKLANEQDEHGNNSFILEWIEFRWPFNKEEQMRGRRRTLKRVNREAGDHSFGVRQIKKEKKIEPSADLNHDPGRNFVCQCPTLDERVLLGKS